MSRPIHHPTKGPLSPDTSAISDPQLRQVFSYVEEYMRNYDGSHDFLHVLRVLGLAHTLRSQDPTKYDNKVTTLAALLHDVGDKKYLSTGQDPTSMVRDVLLSFGYAPELADTVQAICSGVSYSTEIKDPSYCASLITQHPELAIVQDADRLDAIGAVGIGRTFTFGGAKKADGMWETVAHFEEKLERLEGMMKTEMGRMMARERTERLVEFRRQWEEECEEARQGVLGIEGLEGILD
jgi:uncharacterized protein